MAEPDYEQTLVEMTPEQTAELQRRNQLYQGLVESFPVSLGKEVSKAERETKDISDSTLTYGELEFTSLGETFYKIQNNFGGFPEGNFYDLGSGTGKGCLTGALLHPFPKCIGIEILDGLYNVSMELKAAYETSMPQFVTANADLFPTQPELEFVHSDFFEKSWEDAGLVFANSTCFSRDMMDRLAAQPVRPGTIAITLTKNFSSDLWEQLDSERKNMSWGDATVFISRRRPS